MYLGIDRDNNLLISPKSVFFYSCFVKYSQKTWENFPKIHSMQGICPALWLIIQQKKGSIYFDCSWDTFALNNPIPIHLRLWEIFLIQFSVTTYRYQISKQDSVKIIRRK